MRCEQQGAIFAAVDSDGDVFHGEGLSIKEGVKPVEDEGAQGEADGHGGEDVEDGVAVHGLAPDEVMDKDLQDMNSFEFVKVAITVIPSNGCAQFFSRRLVNCPSLIGYAMKQADQLAFFKVIGNMAHGVCSLNCVGRVAQLVNDVGIFAVGHADFVWRGVHVAVIRPHDVGLSAFDANGKDNVDVAVDVKNDDVAAFELRCCDALAVLCVFAASVECESFHGCLSFIQWLPFPRGSFERKGFIYACQHHEILDKIMWLFTRRQRFDFCGSCG